MPRGTDSKVEFTQTWIDGLVAPEAGKRAYTDTLAQGFRLRHTSTGTKSFEVQYRLDATGAVKSEHIGTYAPVREYTIAGARKLAIEWLPLLKAGINPHGLAKVGNGGAAQKKIAAGARKSLDELRDLYVHYFRHDKAPKRGSKVKGRRSWEATRDHLKVVCVDMGWGSMFPDEITEDKAMKLLKDLRDVRGINPNRIHSTLIQLFIWLKQPGAVCEDFARPAVNPFIELERQGEETKNERTLSPEEIVYFWRALTTNSGKGNEPRSRNTKRVLMLLLLTAQRLSQILYLTRSNVQTAPDGSLCFVWEASEMKGMKDHVLPMSPLVRQIVEQAMRETNGELIFPSLDPRCFGQPMGRQAPWLFFSNLVQASDGALEPAKVHDLRATGATMLFEEEDANGELVHQPHEISTIMSHAQHTDKRAPAVSYGYFRPRKRKINVAAFRGYAAKVRLVNALERLVLAEAGVQIAPRGQARLSLAA